MLIKLLVLMGVMYLPLMWLQNNYRLGLDLMEGEHCLPYTTYIIDLNDKDISKENFFAFSSKGMEPFYEDGTQVIKIAKGMPGDLVTVTNEVIRLNHQKLGEMIHIEDGGKLIKLGRKAEDYVREELIPEGEIFAYATHPRSYDSRYWGNVSNKQVIGRAFPLF
jgi:conjugal transfer pilin signal peptidase TrbI